MPEDLLNTPSERAALKATIHQNSEAFLRQLCLNRGLETYNKTRSDLEQVCYLSKRSIVSLSLMPCICQMVINLINAMDDANIGATQAAPGGKTFAPAEPVDDLSVHIDEVSMSPLYCNRPPCTGWLLSARLLARCTLLCLAQFSALLEIRVMTSRPGGPAWTPRRQTLLRRVGGIFEGRVGPVLDWMETYA